MSAGDTAYSSGSTQRWRITARHTSAELRGYLDGDVGNLEDLANAVRPLGWVIIASPADVAYDPFRSTDG